VGGGGGAAWVAAGVAATVAVCAGAAGVISDFGVSDGFAAVAVCDGDVVLTSDAEAGAAAWAEVAVASFEACVAGDVVFAMLSLDEAGVDCAAGFVTAAGAGTGAGDDTVADSTLAVILGEPAELGVVTVGPALAGGGAAFALASVDATV
jgi:hypothetical protein